VDVFGRGNARGCELYFVYMIMISTLKHSFTVIHLTRHGRHVKYRLFTLDTMLGVGRDINTACC